MRYLDSESAKLYNDRMRMNKLAVLLTAFMVTRALLSGNIEIAPVSTSFLDGKKGRSSCDNVLAAGNISILTQDETETLESVALLDKVSFADFELRAENNRGFFLKKEGRKQSGLFETIEQALNKKIRKCEEILINYVNSKAKKDICKSLSFCESVGNRLAFNYHFEPTETSDDVLLENYFSDNSSTELWKAIGNNILDIVEDKQRIKALDLSHICNIKVGVMKNSCAVVLLYCKRANSRPHAKHRTHCKVLTFSDGFTAFM